MNGLTELEKQHVELALKLEEHRRSQLGHGVGVPERARKSALRPTSFEESRTRPERVHRQAPAAEYQVRYEPASAPAPAPEVQVPQRAVLPATRYSRPHSRPPILPVHHLPAPTETDVTSEAAPSHQSDCFSAVYLVLHDLILTLGHLCGTVASAILIFLLGITHILLTSLFLIASIVGDFITILLRYFFNLITCRYDAQSWKWEWTFTSQVWEWGRGSLWVWRVVGSVTGVSVVGQKGEKEKSSRRGHGHGHKERPRRTRDLERGQPTPTRMSPPLNRV